MLFAMPDRRQHRGANPEDIHAFAESEWPALRTAVAELCWLLTRDYAENSALKLVGDRHNLSARQRMAVRRCACPAQSLKQRTQTRTTLERHLGGCVGVDGYNLLITLESAISGGLILVGLDGCYRDLASIHGTYRRVEETVPALRLLSEYLTKAGMGAVDWYLDRPVSNSGRLKQLMLSEAAGLSSHSDGTCKWNIELVDSPDRALLQHPGPIVTTDSVVLDRCGSWINLAAEIINGRIPRTWKVSLGGNGGEGAMLHRFA